MLLTLKFINLQYSHAQEGGANSLGYVAVTVTTKSQQVKGALHQVGSVGIGRVADMLFYIAWDATIQRIVLGMRDERGFEVFVVSPDSDAALTANRPNQPEMIQCKQR